jgi:HSP20 family protein
MRRFSEEMDRLFDDFGFGSGSLFSPSRSSLGGTGAFGRFGPQGWAPAVEVFTRGEKLIIRADVPGVNKEDLKVEVQNGAITIEGERRRESDEETEGRWHTERSYGRFVRTIALPEGARPDDARATFKDGVLEIAVTLPEETRGRRIQIEG